MITARRHRPKVEIVRSNLRGGRTRTIKRKRTILYTGRCAGFLWWPMAKPLVGIIMGSSSDWETMQHAVQILADFGVAHEAKVVSAHRMPDEMFRYAEAAEGRGLVAIIAGAGGAAHGFDRRGKQGSRRVR